MSESAFAKGGCACGAIRFELLAAPMFTHCCHCRDCQRQTGSAFVLNALIETDRIALLQGEPRPFPMPTPSGFPHDIYRCADCGTALWSDYGGRTGLRFVRVGALDEPELVPPDVHIFTRSKLPWIGLPPETPAFEIYYERERLWPAAAQERLRQATQPPGKGVG
ncbi:MAG: GFA family protein [Caulobacteraceae bacterium]|nr:GFA family protein [Caulobacteraceae bacterium]